MNEVVRDIEAESESLVALPEGKKAQDVLATLEPTGIDPILADLKKRIDARLALGRDVSTANGREEIKRFAFAITRSKTAFEKIGKAVADDVKSIPKRVDASRKKWTDTVEAWRDDYRQPLTDWEAAETARVNKHKDVLARIELLAIAGADAPADTIRANITEVERLASETNGEEFAAEYTIGKDKALGLLAALLVKRVKYESDQAELERLRAKEAEREAEERAERLRKEGEQRARDEAEADARAESQRVELQRIASEKEQARLIAENDRLKDEAERRATAAAAAERQRIEDEKAAEEAEQKRREANRNHCAKINRTVLAAFVANGIPEDTAKTIIKLIASGAIRSVSIQY